MYLKKHLLSSHGAELAATPSLAESTMLFGSGSECLTIAPYRPYSAMMELRPHVFSVLRHLARLFWNQTYNGKIRRGMKCLWGIVGIALD